MASPAFLKKRFEAYQDFLVRNPSAEKNDWIDNLYMDAVRRNARLRPPMDPDYPDPMMRAYQGYRDQGVRDSIEAGYKKKDDARNKADAERMSALQRDWIEEGTALGAIETALARMAWDGTRNVERETFLLSCIARDTMRNRVILQEAEEFLAEKGEDATVQVIKRWREDCEMVAEDHILYAMNAMVTGAGQAFDEDFEIAALKMRAAEYTRNGLDQLHSVRTYQGSPGKPYDGWEQDQSRLDEMLSVYEPVTMARAKHMLLEASGALAFHRAPCAEEFWHSYAAGVDRALKSLSSPPKDGADASVSGRNSPKPPNPALP